MSDQFYRPTGELQGDDRPMPDRGTGTGLAGNAATGGRSLERDATNRQGAITGATRSDPMATNMPCGDGRK